MTDRLRIALAQLDPVVGDLRGNAAHIRAARAEAAAEGADLLLTPRGSLSGWPLEGLGRDPAFLRAVAGELAQLAAETTDGGPGLVVGAPWGDNGRCHDGLVLLDGGRITARRARHEHEAGDVFDPGPAPGPVAFRGVRLGLMAGADWRSAAVAETLAETGAELLVALDAAPFEAGTAARRVERAVARVVETGLGLLWLNQVGAHDGLVLDGASFALNPDRALALQMPQFAEALVVTEWERGAEGLACRAQPPAALPDGLEEIWRAMMLGLAGQVRKGGFPGVLLGLSGGIDSALTAALAADALGPDRVRSVMLPSPYTSLASREDAAECARLLGISHEVIAIAPAMEAFGPMLAPSLGGTPLDLTAENLQSRLRGVTLMALANASGEMLLTTANKSELATGYATLYGDTCGALAPLGDAWKSMVFALARWRNGARPPGALGPEGPVMPERVLTKPPSAELHPGQTDQDSLPPYAELDAILAGLVERGEGVEALAAAGDDRATVLRMRRLLHRAEFKRRQAPPSVKLGPHAFGREWRYPVTHGFMDGEA